MLEGQQGSVLIRGDIVTEDGFARDRYILVRDGVIAEIGRRRPARSDDLPFLDTQRGDWIFPGLINLHTHSTYNFLPIWASPDAPFDNRFEWRGNPGYKAAVSQVASKINQGDRKTTVSVFGELQAVAGGTAILQEDFALDQEKTLGGLLLCRDTASPADLGMAPGGLIQSVVDFFRPSSAGVPTRQDSIGRYAAARDNGTLIASIVHLAEGRSGFGSNRGVDPYSRAEFEAFMALPEMADTEKVRATPFSIVHGCGIDPRNPVHMDFQRERGISIVWSPVSNLLLYGDTIDAETLLAEGINVALGSDWSPSGSKHVWDEAKFARAYFDAIGSPVPDELIFRMASVNAARCLRATRSGRIAEGALADFFILRSPTQTDNPHEVFLGTEDRHVLATIIGGRPIYGDRGLLSAYTADLQPLPKAEGSAVSNKAVCLPPSLAVDVDRDVSAMEAALKALTPPVWRSNLLASSDKLYRRRMKTLRAWVQDFGWGVREWRHKGPSPTPGRIPVDPGLVRVWQGRRREGVDGAGVGQALSAVILPGAVALQVPIGLTAHISALLPDDRPEAAPDVVALDAFESPEAYGWMTRCAGGRAYTLLHEAVFTPAPDSQGGFPERFDATLKPGTAAYLIDAKADWHVGAARVYVGARPQATPTDRFLADLAALAQAVQADPPPGLDGAIVSAGPDIVVWWRHWSGEAPAADDFAQWLAAVATPVMDAAAVRKPVPPDLVWDSPGVAIAPGQALNLRFERRGLRPW